MNFYIFIWNIYIYILYFTIQIRVRLFLAPSFSFMFWGIVLLHNPCSNWPLQSTRHNNDYDMLHPRNASNHTHTLGRNWYSIFTWVLFLFFSGSFYWVLQTSTLFWSIFLAAILGAIITCRSYNHMKSTQ